MHFFFDPPPSVSDESRPRYVVDLLLLTGIALVPVAVLGIVRLSRDHRLRPLAAAIAGVVAAYLVLGGKSYYAMPVLLLALAAGAVSFERWAAGRTRRVALPTAAFALTTVALLLVDVPVLPAATAADRGIVDLRSDYEDEIGWPGLVAAVEDAARGASAVVAENYGEARALVVVGHSLRPVASGHLSFRYWRPRDLSILRGVVVGYQEPAVLALCALADGRAGSRTASRTRSAGGTFAGGSLAAVWARLLSD